MSWPRFIPWALFSWTCVLAAADPPPRPSSPPVSIDLTADQVMNHLNQVVNWYRHIQPLEQSPALSDDLIARDRLHETSTTALRLAFDFGRAAGALVSVAPVKTDASDDVESSDDPDDPGQLQRISTQQAAQMASLQSQLDRLDGQLSHVNARERAVLAAQRAEVVAALALAREIADTIQNLQHFAATSTNAAGGSGSLLAAVDDLERTIPEARHALSAATNRGAVSGPGAAPNAPAASSGVVQSHSQASGLITLASEWLALRTAHRQLQDVISETDALSVGLDKLRGALTRQVRGVLKNSLAGATGTDVAQLSAQRLALTDATARFKQLSTLLVPLGEEDISVDSARNTLAEREAAAERRATDTVRDLLFRVGILAASIALVILISAVWRRATFRYLHDARRRRQFLMLRRIVTGVALTLIILMAFVSEVGSLATYVGFLTAGLAVALQNVILAVVAYFFLIGRYGVKVGDRITLAGVTGRVVEIGLVRIYLMELAGADLRSTGRMIVLSNAVLFQPSALFKQIPGADYAWHTVTLTLAPGADLSLAQTRLKAAADAVYEKYRVSIEKQFAAVQRQIDFEAKAPSPEIHARFTEKGIEFSVRYPVEPEHAAATDQHMVKKLREVLDEAPALPLAETGAPTLQESSVLPGV